ncbi:hypothetical protein ACF0H5_001023 [Mactra antiquata]
MNSQGHVPIRPSGTYSLDENGNIIRSRDINMFIETHNEGTTAIDEISDNKRVLKSSSSTSTSSWSSSGSSDMETALKDADDLLTELDEMLDETKYDVGRVHGKQKIHGVENDTNNKSTPSKDFVSSVLCTVQLDNKTSDTHEFNEAIQHNTPSTSARRNETKESVGLPQTLPDGLMAIRLPPLFDPEILAAAYQKRLREKRAKREIKNLEAKHFLPPTGSINNRTQQHQSTQTHNKGHDQEATYRQALSGFENGAKVISFDNEIDKIIYQVSSEMLGTVEAKTSPVQTQRRSGLKKYICGLCGGSSEDNIEETDYADYGGGDIERAKSDNCLQRLWKRIKKWF